MQEDDNHSDKVARFLEEIENDTPPQRTLGDDVRTRPAINYAPVASNAKDQPKMSNIDQRRATPDNYNARTAAGATGLQSPSKQPHPM